MTTTPSEDHLQAVGTTMRTTTTSHHALHEGTGTLATETKAMTAAIVLRGQEDAIGIETSTTGLREPTAIDETATKIEIETGRTETAIEIGIEIATGDDQIERRNEPGAKTTGDGEAAEIEIETEIGTEIGTTTGIPARRRREERRISAI